MMRRSVCFILFFIFLFLILKCRQTTDTGKRPDRIILVPPAHPTAWEEGGSGADVETDGIRIVWKTPSPMDEVAYVEIFRRKEGEEVFRTIAKVFTPETSYVDTRVAFHVRTEYYGEAVDFDGDRSLPSDTLVYTLFEKPRQCLPQGTIDDPTPRFGWQDPNRAHDAVIRLVEATTKQKIWMCRVESRYEERMEVRYNEDGTASLTRLQSGSSYLWRVDIFESPQAGSKGPWIPITIR